MEALMGLIHGLDFFATGLLIGSIVFAAWIARGPADCDLAKGHGRLPAVLACVSLLTSILWCFFTAADMADSWQLHETWKVAMTTAFGHYILAKSFLVLILLVLSLRHMVKSASIIALVLPLGSSLVGHAGAQSEGISWFLLADYLHFTAVSFWTGGLLGLLFYLRQVIKWPPTIVRSPYDTVRRFSHVAMASTALVGLTGVALAYHNGLASWPPIRTTYAVLVWIKMALFMMALIAASINQFIHLRKWTPDKTVAFTRAVYREVYVEIMFAAAIFVAAGYLTRVSPPNA